MSRWLIGALGAGSDLLLMFLAVLPISLLGNRVPATGVLATVLPVLICVLMLAAIMLPVWVMGRLQRWSNRRRARQAMGRLNCELAQLADDPRLSHWLPLARRQMSADLATIAGWEARYRQLLADPIRNAHADACLQGSFPSNDDIDYLENPARTRCCEHLQGVERGLRQHGFRCGVLQKPASIWAQARIADFAHLRRDHPLDSVVGFSSNVREAFSENDRGPQEVEDQSLYCRRCDSLIRFEVGPAFPSR
ncbi:MAG: hypothetical protein ACT4NL_03690 [Pseudomarimonas sp.]